MIDLVWKKESWEPKTKGFVITGHTVIEQGKNIAFSYESGSGADSGTLYNKGVLKDRGHSVEKRVEQTLLPLLEKWDPSLPGSTFTIHDRKDLTDDTLSWHVLIHIPKSQSDALTITDSLPKSVKYKKAVLFMEDVLLDEAKIIYDGQKITCQLDKELIQKYKGKTLTLLVQAVLNDAEISWRDDEGEDPKVRRTHIRNEAAAVQNDVVLKEVSQTQTITESKVRNRIDKTDPKQSGKNTTHSFDELEEGCVHWQIRQYIEKNQEEALRVEDSIPEPLTWADVKIAVDGKDVKSQIRQTNPEDKLCWELDASFIKNNQGKTVVFDVFFAIPDDFDWNMDPDDPKRATGTFKNTCSVCENDILIDQDEQTQTITNNVFKNSLKKTGSYDESSGILSYSVTINPEQRNFGSGSGLIHVHDRLKYRFKGDQYDSYRVYFMPEKTVLYKVENDGSRSTVPYEDWKLKYEVNTDPWDNGMQRIDIDADVPDGCSLVLEYSYQVLGKKVMDQNISNTVDLSVEDKSYAQSYTSVGVKTITHRASAGTRDITLNKADEENIHHLLEGAEFDLYKYDKNERDYIKVNSEPIRTGTDGRVSLHDGEYDTAYFLKETKAPDGYLLDETPFYFYVVGTDESSVPNMPDGFELDDNTHVFMNHSNIFLTNRSNRTSLTLQKRWLDHSGIEIDPLKEVSCHIVQYASDISPDEIYAYSLLAQNQTTNEVFYDLKNQRVEKGTVLKIMLEVKGSENPLENTGTWKKIDPTSAVSFPGEYGGDSWTRYTYMIPVNESSLSLRVLNWSLRNVSLEIIEPEKEGKIVQTVSLGPKNQYQCVVEDLMSEDIVNRQHLYYTYDVEELPVAGFEVSYEKETIGSGEKIVITNRKMENGGFEFPVTGTNKRQIRKYIGGVMIFGLICVCIYVLKNRRKGNLNK